MPARRSILFKKKVESWLSVAVVLVALPVAVAVLYQTGFLRVNYPVRAAYPIRGLDVSHHQGRIAWSQISPGDYDFAVIKATEGADWVDPSFRANWDGAKAAGLTVGAYHFFSLCKTGLEQARNLIETVPAEPGMLAPVVDLELGGNCDGRPPKADLIRELRQLLDLAAATYGQRPILYTTYEFAEMYLSPDLLRAERVWIRDILRRPRGSFAGAWTFWQFANNGAVDGIATRTDLSVFRGSPEEFRRLTVQPHSQFAKLD